MIQIREEKFEDHDEVRTVNDQAFGQAHEGRIVERVRAVCTEALSLVALSNDQIVGHIFFSPVTIDVKRKHSWILEIFLESLFDVWVDIRDRSVTGMGLGPMAVLPGFQNRSIGARLVQEGIRKIKETVCPFIVVVGHENYFPRFGFERASKFGLRPQWKGVPDNAFMVMILDEEAMRGIKGIVKYRMEFG